MPSSRIPEPISALTPELFDRVKGRIEGNLVNFIKTNRNTRYVCESPVFSEFRSTLDALGTTDDEVQDDMLLESYRASIPLTTYDSYEPFVSKFFERNPGECDVKDMFSPGLPYFIAVSSATSSKNAKFFAKYRHAPGTSYENVDKNANPVSDSGGKNCIVYSLNYRQLIDVRDDEGATVKKVPVTLMSAGSIRMQNGMDVEKDPWMIKLTAPRATSPVAVSFIRQYRSFLLMHVLFALADPQLETVNTLFGTVFIDMIRYMEDEWDMLLDSIETGVLPNWDGVDHVLEYLEPKFHPKPERAAELRAIGKDTKRPGWLKRVWPMLKVVIGIASGVFSSVIPKTRHYLGPDVVIQSLGFTASETYIGTVYNPANVNLFKVAWDDVIEYLDVSKAETASSLVPAYEIEAGNKYEIVITTRDGMWRYRMGDIVEVAGFDPNDGSPLIRYVERRNVAIRLGGAMTSEKQLADAIFAAQDALGPIVEFTVVVDDRTMPSSFGYLVEVQGELRASADQATAQVEADLCRSNPNIKRSLELQTIGSPTIRILEPGTFRDYRRLKIEASNSGSGQMKVPAVMWDQTAQEWMLQRVEREVGA
ncbi:GH3 auxin-responsive promoter [Melanogaster broomeanus]|nr:GH3 auxin-responsive promoter [Melanogaster broomeanus]